MTNSTPARKLTGAHALAIFLGSFGLIFAVNFFMAWNAVRTFPGVEVANSYVASQGFNARLADQRRLGWETRVEVGGGELRLYVTGDGGVSAAVQSLQATLGRATHNRDDWSPAFRRIPGGFAAPVDLEPGNWNLRLTATAADGTEFRQRISFWHRG
jgi:nitrogen fixation protein FixH